jgi:hypothetical protein
MPLPFVTLALVGGLWSLVWLLHFLCGWLVGVGLFSCLLVDWGYLWGGNVLVFVATLWENKPYFVATFGKINLIL